jgi:hypothetical protein
LAPDSKMLTNREPERVVGIRTGAVPFIQQALLLLGVERTERAIKQALRQYRSKI